MIGMVPRVRLRARVNAVLLLRPAGFGLDLSKQSSTTLQVLGGTATFKIWGTKKLYRKKWRAGTRVERVERVRERNLRHQAPIVPSEMREAGETT